MFLAYPYYRYGTTTTYSGFISNKIRDKAKFLLLVI